MMWFGEVVFWHVLEHLCVSPDPISNFSILSFVTQPNLSQFLGTNLCTPFIHQFGSFGHQGWGPQSFGYGEVSWAYPPVRLKQKTARWHQTVNLWSGNWPCAEDCDLCAEITRYSIDWANPDASRGQESWRMSDKNCKRMVRQLFASRWKGRLGLGWCFLPPWKAHWVGRSWTTATAVLLATLSLLAYRCKIVRESLSGMWKKSGPPGVEV